MDDMDIEDARRVLAGQPFSILVGARIDAFGDGRAAVTVPLRDDLRNHSGTMHGGVLAYLADNAIAFAGGTAIGPALLTSGISIEYLRPATGDVTATATVVAHTKRAATCRCELSVDGEVVAVAQGTVRLRGQGGQGGPGGQASPEQRV